MLSGVNSSKKSNANQKFNVHIVEDHNDALEFIYKEIGSKRLNFSNLTMIHFDSHPDLGIPDIHADETFKKDKLLESLSIENWILPSVYAGHLANLVWIKPYWSAQIQAGKYIISIGKHVDTDRIKCDSKESYFISDNMYSPSDSLVNKKTLNLYVCNLDDIVEKTDDYLQSLLRDCDRKDLILDIDLDFFSTQDPFKEMFKNSEEFDLFKKVYLLPFNVDQNDSDFDAKYQDYLEKKSQKLIKIYECVTDKSDEKDDALDRLKEVIEQNKIDFEVLHSYGSGMDDSGLPHHISTDEELKQMMINFEDFLKKYFMSKQPGVVTIARSSLDDYCPTSQVDFIQTQTLDLVASFYENTVNKINHNY